MSVFRADGPKPDEPNGVVPCGAGSLEPYGRGCEQAVGGGEP